MSAPRELKDTIKALRNERGISQKQLADIVNLTQQAIGKWEKGLAEPDSKALAALADFFNVSVDYLLGRAVSKAPSCDICQEQISQNPDNVVIQDFRGTPENEKSPALSSEAVDLARDYDALDEKSKAVVKGLIALIKTTGAAPETTLPVNLGTIRHYLSRPAAGVGGLVEGEDYEDIPRTPDMPKNADYCLTVSGDSMEPYIKNGQMIYVERDAQLDLMDVGVFAVNGEVYVKQYCYYPGVLMLLSANPQREAANITVLESSNDTVAYYGKVILDKKLPEPKYK